MNQTDASNKRLLSFVERIERLETDKAAIADDIKQVKAEAKAVGFDVPTINKIIKLRKQTPEKREEEEALLDIYKAALGMLNGTPLGEAAVKRLSKSEEEPAEEDDEEETKKPPAPEEPPAEEKPAGFMPEVDSDTAREMGKKAAMEGIPVIKNPFPARDPRRAVWDEAWCNESGHDGMDIPAAWRATKPTKAEKKDEK